jgi:hypothetical protein
MNANESKQRTAKRKVGHVPLSLSGIHPSLENDRFYRPVDPRRPRDRRPRASIREHGLMEPIVVTIDGCILSGHPRFAAARLAALPTVH